MIKDVLAILNIRIKQLYRSLAQIGLIRCFILLIILLYAGFAIYINAADIQKAYIISVCWLLIIAYLHYRRKDYDFLFLSMGFSRLICSVEYVVLSVPLFIILLVNKQWAISILLLLCVFFTGFVRMQFKWQQKTLNTCFQKLIFDDMVEWKAGIRKYFYPITGLWILGLFTSFFIASVPIAIFFIGILVIDFYEKNESWQILISSEKSPSDFLLHKIKRHILFFCAIVLPLVLAFIIFHTAYWYIVVIEVFVLLSVHIFSVVLKYAYYSYDKKSGNFAFLTVGIFIGLIPVTAPFLLIFSVYLFFKARYNLEYYLHDYN